MINKQEERVKIKKKFFWSFNKIYFNYETYLSKE